MTRFDDIDVRFDLRQAAQARRIAEFEDRQQADAEIIASLQDQVIERQMAFEHLEGALVESRRIGAAIGIVMNVEKVTEDVAFGILAKISQRQNRKLRLIANDIVLTGMF